MHYQLDNYLQRNPYQVWSNGGQPVYPPYTLLQAMREAAVSYMCYLINSYKPKRLDVIQTRIAHHCCQATPMHILQPLTEKKSPWLQDNIS